MSTGDHGSRRTPSAFKLWRRRRRADLARIGLYVVRRLPLAAIARVAPPVGEVVRLLAGRERRRAMRNLERVFGERLPRAGRRRVVRRMFRSWAVNAAAAVRLGALPAAELRRRVTLLGREHVDRVRASGRGAVVVSGHLGAWDLAPAAMVAWGYDGAVVARRNRDPGLQEVIERARSSLSLPVVHQDDGPRELIRVVRRGDLVAMLADVHVSRLDGVWTTFLGLPARVLTAPVTLACTGRGALVPCVIRAEEPARRWSVRFLPPVELPDDPRDEEQVRRATRAWLEPIERAILERPEQWIWNTRRWRTVPPEEQARYEAAGLTIRGPSPMVAVAPGKRRQ